MKKNKWFYTILAILSISTIGILYIVLFYHGFDITITNKTDQDIKNLIIIDGRKTKQITIPTIDSNKQYKTKIDLKDVGENSLTLNYQDNNKKMQEVVIFGYFEGKGTGTIDIVIRSIRQDGTLDIQVKQK
ncbi:MULTISPECIES: hypothetical protein [unclassified Bacillus (in: firmicutes)]|uniref:hypothetical protein n=1 Tax=unclassified Bacillus (in: firmicutes) TaxID=185979 RepID=UPI0008E90CE4|nr:MULTISPECIES: hypothetical protein [unclassified Bacillus (in: firmicutes)]SFI27411.1 hypothetical protein SAMN04488574_102190 [Bacillus sp. 71mf]SFS39964.1 hypothetical protein SAMN04488145_101276 [Bacillus sp. 103mf]